MAADLGRRRRTVAHATSNCKTGAAGAVRRLAGGRADAAMHEKSADARGFPASLFNPSVGAAGDACVGDACLLSRGTCICLSV